GVFLVAAPIHRGATVGGTGYSDRFTCGGSLHDCAMYRRSSVGNPFAWHTVHRWVPTQNSRRNSYRHHPDTGACRGNRWHLGTGRQAADAMAEAGGMNIIQETFSWLTNGSTWNAAGNDLLGRSLEHLQYSGMAVAIAAVVAIPAGWFMGQSGRFAGLVVAITGAARALPSLGLITLFGLLLGIGLVPPMIALVVLAIPSILAGTYSGIQTIDPAIQDAA